MPDPEFSQFQKISQEQTLSPQILHALKILQVPSIELAREISDELAKNPLLEEIPGADSRFRETLPAASGDGVPANSDESETPDVGSDAIVHFPDSETGATEGDFPESESWRDDESAVPAGDDSAWSPDAELRRSRMFESLVETESLPQLLESQIALASSDSVPAEQLRAIAQNLDERGFLETSVESLSESLGVPVVQIERALQIFQNFDPPGIGARDLREAFLIQLRRQGRTGTPAYRLLDTEYALFLSRKFPQLAARLKISDDELRAAISEISKLKRVPAGDFAADENREISPDLTFFFDKEKRRWDVRLENAYIPRLRISNVYKELLAQGKIPAKDRAYISERMRAGRFLINAIEQRQKTILQIARCIIDAQREFFEIGPEKLRPMTMAGVAAEIGVHETTVSRAVSGKFADTPHGVFELRKFFNAGLATDDGDALASAGVREVLRDVIASESPRKPFSDEKLVSELAARGIKIARRTVAKYRAILKIPPAHLRRKF